ncbi:MAG: hypothetical protein PHR39_04715 [Actinomycetota bacterium]|nr:hypothetical protein [Actinomycetota bacterium]
MSKNKFYDGEIEEKSTKSQFGSTIKYDVNKCFIGLFNDYDIDINQNIQNQILNENKRLDANFYRRLFYYIEILMNIRNSISNTGIDDIKCPCCGFDSEKEKIQNFV